MNKKKFKTNAYKIIEFKTNTKKQISLLNLQGQKIAFFEAQSTSSLNTIDFNEGIYFLQIKDDNHIYTEKLILLHH